MIATRLKAGEDLKHGIGSFVRSNNYSSAAVVSAVGSLSEARIRMAGAKPNAEDVRVYTGVHEIVSLIGTIDNAGKSHLHISIADPEGAITGGHLKEGCIVHTTVELVLVTDPSLIFERRADPETGFDELRIERSK